LQHATGEYSNHPVAVKAFEALNFSDAFDKETYGGRGNYYRAGQLGGGAKLANIWSWRFEMCTCNGVHTVEAVWTLTDEQVTSNSIISELPQRRNSYTMKPCTGCEQGTKITMYPNLKAFNINSLEDASVNEMVENRCYTLQAHVGKPRGVRDENHSKLNRLLEGISISVYFNGEALNVGCMKDLARRFFRRNPSESPIAAYRDTWRKDEYGHHIDVGLDIAIFQAESEHTADKDLFVANGVNATR